jgi:hypothetical protein
MTEQPKSVSEETVDPFNLDALRLSRISPKRSPSKKAVRAPAYAAIGQYRRVAVAKWILSKSTRW